MFKFMTNLFEKKPAPEFSCVAKSIIEDFESLENWTSEGRISPLSYSCYTFKDSKTKRVYRLSYYCGLNLPDKIKFFKPDVKHSFTEEETAAIICCMKKLQEYEASKELKKIFPNCFK
jgi:hypothetical protein